MVSDLSMAMDEFKVRFDLCLSVLENIGIENNDIEMALRTTKDFFEQNKGFILDLVNKLGKPILIELWDERIFYFILKFEFNFVDMSDKASALSTDQIDIENGERYGITFTEKDGKQKHPLILHCSPSGAIERVMYALLEKEALKMNKGIKPMLPLWISPTQIRCIPVGDEYVSHCEQLIQEFNNICDCSTPRIDIDDREQSVGKKIRDAEKEWIPIILVIGDKEIQSKQYQPRFRSEEIGNNNQTYSLQELHTLLKNKTKGYPMEALPLPLFLSKRPRFK
jgi:threonyl-tRNA synthetase